MTRKSGPTGERGLTLIELLLLVALVAFLALVFWPHTCTSRPLARRSACLSNLKQIGLAAALYRQDYDDTFFWNPEPGGLPASYWAPAFRPSDCAAQPTTSFAVLLLPYVKYSMVFQCPEYPGHHPEQHLGYWESLATAGGRTNLFQGSGVSSNADWTRKIGYGFNEALIASSCRPRTLSSLRRDPAEIALLADADRPWASAPGQWIKTDGEWNRYWSVDLVGPLRHEPGQNFVYADGHARFLEPRLERGVGEGEGKEAHRGYYPRAKLD